MVTGGLVIRLRAGRTLGARGESVPCVAAIALPQVFFRGLILAVWTEDVHSRSVLSWCRTVSRERSELLTVELKGKGLTAKRLNKLQDADAASNCKRARPLSLAVCGYVPFFGHSFPQISF